MTIQNVALRCFSYFSGRQFHSCAPLFATPSAASKSSLAKLRKATGYSFTRCKEALEKHNHDLKEAEKWLRSQAQAHGWQKASKLQGRATAQGLVTILSSPNNAVLLEINCETDFVARNKKFEALCHKLAQSCFTYSNFSKERNPPSNDGLIKTQLSSSDLIKIPTGEGTLLQDELAISIGDLGENIQARRATFLQSSDSVLLAGYTHPASNEASKPVVQVGKFGAIVAYRLKGKSKQTADISEFGRQLCQHIVGMNPIEIGEMEEPETGRKKPKRTETNESTGSTEESDDTVVELDTEPDETVLLDQEFLLDPDLTVREFLTQNSIEVVDFVRYECGEHLENV